MFILDLFRHRYTLGAKPNRNKGRLLYDPAHIFFYGNSLPLGKPGNLGSVFIMKRLLKSPEAFLGWQKLSLGNTSGWNKLDYTITRDESVTIA